MTQAENSVPIPPATDIIFKGGIKHPDLWLWDSWTRKAGSKHYLYCLALSRTTINGEKIAPHQRNAYPFHVRQFTSSNGGQSWRDEGAFFTPSTAANSNSDANIWSGSVEQHLSGVLLFAFTGIKKLNADRPFLQSICLAQPGGQAVPDIHIISDPEKDYDLIRDSGYYLGPRDQLGDRNGEEGGPILAWRDPYIFIDASGKTHLFWSAKSDPQTPVIAHASITKVGGKWQLEKLHPPICLPDGHDYTQAEVPKLYQDKKRDCYYLLVSSCDRLCEGQADDSISKQLRLYKSLTIEGPWHSYCQQGSRLSGLEGLFGGSILDADFESGDALIIAPYTEMAAPDFQLTFAPPQYFNLFGQTPTVLKYAEDPGS
jgi:hypothetical protein